MPIARQRTRMSSSHVEPLDARRLFAFGLTTSTSLYTVDTGAGLVFSVQRTASQGAVGDLTAATYNGKQMLAPFGTSSRYSHYASGLGSGTVMSAQVDANKQWVLITCADAGGYGVTHYYLARSGHNNIYMATYSAGPDSPSPGEMRFITYTNPSVLTNVPAPSKTNGSAGAIESSDVFGFADGTTASKYYGEHRAIDTQTYGVTGSGVGLYMNIGNRETSSGGPFYKDIDFQNNELYTYVFSGHSQTEAFRPGLKGFYALEFTNGANPGAPDYTFIDTLGVGGQVAGYVGSAGRGAVTGTATGVPSTLATTVGLSNAADQYWATPNGSTGAYAINGVLPGTYTETIYQGELAVGTRSVSVSAGRTTTADITSTRYTPAAASTAFRIGTWDGTPLGFLNADKITNMHPTDTRITPWATTSAGLTNFVVGTDADATFPMAEWHAQTGGAPYVDTDNRITFTLTAAQAAAAQTFRIGLTRLDSARPNVTVNTGTSYSWTSATQSIAAQPDSRGLTTGNWRGNNVTYTFNIPLGKLHAGTNTIDISSVSGSAGTLYSGYHIYDAIDLVTTASLTNAPKVTTIAVTPTNATSGVNVAQLFSAIAKDQFGTATPANLAWSATRGTIDDAGNYVAPSTPGADTITATSGTVVGRATINVVNATVAARATFYNNSSFDGNDGGANAADDGAIAADKRALLPGQTATFANYTSYSRGINGVIVDVANLTSTALTTADFAFRVGNSNDPSTWAIAPAPTTVLVRPGAGANGSARVELIWADNVIAKAWLQVTLLADATTGLAADDVFYFGNAIGETGDSPGEAAVNTLDIGGVRENQSGRSVASIFNAYDFNRDGRVDILDIGLARENQSGRSPLQLITIDAIAAPAAASAARATVLRRRRV